MDGTLLDSSAAMKRIWGDWAGRFGFEPASFIAKIHGVRVVVVTATHEKHHGTAHHAIAHYGGAKVAANVAGLHVRLQPLPPSPQVGLEESSLQTVKPAT